MKKIVATAKVLVFISITAMVWIGALTSPSEVANNIGTHDHSTMSRSEVLMDKHHCWSGSAPADMVGKLPMHAVYSLPGKEAAYGPSSVGFDIWLKGKPGSLAGFCR